MLIILFFYELWFIIQPKFPVSIYGLGFLLSITGYMGVNLVLTLVRVAGAFAAVTVMTIFLIYLKFDTCCHTTTFRIIF
jgi:hypothetical protein